MNPSSFNESLSAIVGSENVLVDAATLAVWSRSTVPESTRPVGIVRPKAATEVQSIMRLAAQHRVPVHPISRGKNWGYGDACASVDGCLIIDLSRMNRIVEVNAELAYAVIEPGVSQGQLVRYLEEKGIPLMLDGNGAGPEASIVGNIAERGYGHSAYGDRFSNSCNFEVVLADGTLMHTGFGDFPGAKGENTYKWGYGPAIDGLFTQSNFGIITRLTIWLMPKGDRVLYYFLGLPKDGDIDELTRRLAPLFRRRTLRSVLHCANRYRLLASATRFPWEKLDGKQALDVADPALTEELCRRFHVRAWSCAGIIHGSAAEVRAAYGELRGALSGMKKLFFSLTPGQVKWALWGRDILRRFGIMPNVVDDIQKAAWMVDLLDGKPSEHFLGGAHWRARRAPGATLDPLATGAGLIWISPILPMTPEAVREVNTIGQRVFQEHGFEYHVTITFPNERTMGAVMSVSFCRDDRDECARAEACEEKLLSALCEKGYYPYRGSLGTQRFMRERFPAYWERFKKLRACWDPENILSPNHYIG